MVSKNAATTIMWLDYGIIFLNILVIALTFSLPEVGIIDVFGLLDVDGGDHVDNLSLYGKSSIAICFSLILVMRNKRQKLYAAK